MCDGPPGSGIGPPQPVLPTPGQPVEMVATAPDSPPSVAGGERHRPVHDGGLGVVIGLHCAVVNEGPALPDLHDEAGVTVTGAGDCGRLHQPELEPSPLAPLSRSSSSSDLNRGR